MGIYDREYYRDPSRGVGLFLGVAPACRVLLLINVAVFLLRWASPPANFELDRWCALHTDDLFERGMVWQLVTSAFLHSRELLFHLLGNMLMLWLVGTEMELMYGRREFVAMYLSAAAISGLTWAICDKLGGGHGVMLGASGAIMAIVVLYALYYPRRTILIYGVFPVEIWILAIVYIGYDLVRLLSSPNVGGGTHVAFASHLGGAAYGYLYKRFDLRWTRLLALARPARRPRFRVISADPREPATPGASSLATVPSRTVSPSPDIPRATPPGPSFPEEQLNARLDEVLAKIASQGPQSLTDEEHRILQEASRRARSRRDQTTR